MPQVIALEWHEVEQEPIYGEQYFAHTKRGRYDIMRERGRLPGQHSDRWKTSRMDHPLMPPFDGWCPSLAAAKLACERDYPALMRADRWLDYMQDNEPPR